MQRHSAQQLHVKVTHLHDTLAALAHHGKRLWEKVVQCFSRRYPVLELFGFRAKLIVIELLVFRLQRIDALNCFAVGFKQPVIAAAENFGQYVGSHRCEASLSLP